MNDHKEDLLADVRGRLRSELDDLYSKASGRRDEQGDPETQRRIARILRTFHLIESGQYGTCLTCGVGISTAWLSKHPTSDACEACAPPQSAMLS